MDQRQLLYETADALQMSADTLATIISYETGGTFNPRKKGPVTQWGQHEGFIQFGEPQAKEHGADFSSDEAAITSQLGANGAIVRYFKSRGWKPGMSELDAYSIVNAGSPGMYNASDAANGGAAGTVADKVATQFGPHRANAQKWLGGSYTSRDRQDTGWAAPSGMGGAGGPSYGPAPASGGNALAYQGLPQVSYGQNALATPPQQQRPQLQLTSYQMDPRDFQMPVNALSFIPVGG